MRWAGWSVRWSSAKSSWCPSSRLRSSLGGEVRLEAAARDGRLRAVVADGAERAEDDLRLGFASGLERRVSAITTQMVRGISGTRRPPALLDVIAGIAPRPVLLIA